MQNTAVQTTSQSLFKVSGSATKASSSKEKTSTVSAENVDPYLQIFLSLLSQDQSSGEAQTQEGTEVAAGTVQQPKSLEDVLSMLNAQSLSELQSAASAQSTADAQSALDAQSTADAQSAANTQVLAMTQTSTETQSPVNLQSVADLLSTVSLRRVADLLNSVSTQSAADAQRTSDIQSEATTQSTSELQNATDLQMLKDIIQNALEKNEAAVANQGTATEATQASAAASTQTAADTEGTLSVKLDNVSDVAGLSEAQNASIKAELQSNKATNSDKIDTVDASTAKDNTETVSKPAESSSTTDSGNKSNDKEIDVKSFQAEVLQNKEINSSEASFKTEAKTSETSVSNQIATDVSKNLALGKNEFTVKLTPESLGEITVKLITENGQTTLSITTASAHTAKLINEDLSALKEAVSQMNVHVNEAVAKSDETGQSSMQQYNMAGQSGQQYAGGQAYAHAAYAAAEDSDSTYADQTASQVKSVSAQKNPSSGIDTYI